MNRYFTGFLLLLALFGFSSCSNQPSEEGYKDMLAVRMAMPMQPSSALSIIAAEKGYFKKRGLDVIFTEFPSGKLALRDGLLAGNSDVAFSSDVPVVAAALGGKDIHVVATTFLASDVNRIIARRDHGISAPADLKGKRVATQRASAVHFFLSLFLSKNNLSLKDVELSYMNAGSLPEALASGAIDAFSMREPYISEAKKLLGDYAVIFTAQGLYQQFDGVVVDSNFLDRNPEVIRRLLQALLDAEVFAFSAPDQAIKLVADRLGVSAPAVAPLWSRHSLKVSLDQSYLLLLEDISRWMLNTQASNGSISPEYLKIIDTGPLERIDPNRISLIR